MMPLRTPAWALAMLLTGAPLMADPAPVKPQAPATWVLIAHPSGVGPIEAVAVFGVEASCWQIALRSASYPGAQQVFWCAPSTQVQTHLPSTGSLM